MTSTGIFRSQQEEKSLLNMLIYTNLDLKIMLSDMQV